MGTLSGLTYALAAAVAFGVQYVPVKRYEIFDGTTFQWFMCSGILMVAVVISFSFGELGESFSLEVVFGGMLWALSNYFVLPLVKLLGIGLGFSLYHFVNLMVGYVVGRFGVFGVSRLQGSLELCDSGCLLILISFVIMVFVEEAGPNFEDLRTSLETAGSITEQPPLFDGIDQEYRRQYHRWRLGESRGSKDPKVNTLFEHVGGAVLGFSASETGSKLRSVGGLSMHCQPHVPHRSAAPRLTEIRSEPLLESDSRSASDSDEGRAGARSMVKAFGVLLALLAGSLAGVQSVPAALYNSAHPDASATSVVFPQCLGIWIISSLIYLGYASLAKLRGWSVPHSAIRPAYLGGAIWAAGFAFMIGGIRDLGYSVGYTLDAVGPIVVASMLSVFVFREITERRQLVRYWFAFTLQLAGVILIAANGKQSS
mmetsp:Transcript_50375/g.155751  ORF Transcript_50375/g.155751 Transcript_50375/m.155751 type:complete len:427 (+) Transcript_50375:64-1344(+)